MNRSRFHTLAAPFFAALFFVAPARAAAAADGAALVQRYADAIVGVEMVVTIKVRVGDREAPPRERRVEINGTVISPTGLTVASLLEVDPQAEFDAMRASQAGGSRLELVGADFKEVKFRLADGSEVPARIVLRDADLDLAFMAPEVDAPAREFAHVKLEESAEGALLSEYFFVSRAPKSLQRVPLIRQSKIMGIVEKPRRFYLTTENSVGTPLFGADGRVLGLSLFHLANNRRSVVVVPAPDIAEMAKQAAAVQTGGK